jgi:accessory gene regulator B
MVAAGVERPASVPVIQYALHIVFNTAGGVILSLVIGGLTGNFGATALTLAAFALLRYLTGGYHMKSGVACVIVSSAIVSAIPHVALPEIWTYVVTAAALVITAIKAPANYDKYARIPKRYYPLLKLIACGVIAVNFAVGSEILAITYIVQALLLLGGENKNET